MQRVQIESEGATSFPHKALLKLDKGTSLFVETVEELTLSRSAGQKAAAASAR